MRILFLSDLYPEQINLYKDPLVFDKQDSLKILEKTQGWSHMMINGLKVLGHEVFPLLVLPGFDMSSQKSIFSEIYKFNPNIIIVENARLLSPIQIKELRDHLYECIFITHSCSKIKDGPIIFEYYDKVLCCSPYFYKSLPLNNEKKVIFYNACPEKGFEIVKKNLNQINNKCTFFGSLYRKIHDNRKGLLSYLLSRNLPIDIYSSSKGSTNLSPIINKISKFSFSKKLVTYLNKLEEITFNLQYPKLKNLLPPSFDAQMLTKLSSYNCCLNVHTEAANGYAANLRLFECASVGTCIITEHFPNISDLFKPGEEVLTYSSKEECFEKIQYCLNNPSFSRSIGAKAKLRALNEHTYLSRVKNLTFSS